MRGKPSTQQTGPENAAPGAQAPGRRSVTGEIAASAPAPQSPAISRLPPSRVGKKPVTAYVERNAHKQLRSLGLDLDKSAQDMIIEALNDYFERHGLDRIA